MKLVKDDIGVVDASFLRNEELLDIVIKNNDWTDVQGFKDSTDVEQGTEMYKELLDTLEFYVNEYGKNYPALRITELENIKVCRYVEGQSLPLHADDILPVRKVSVVLFLNGDYTGGEMVFPSHNVDIQPKAGRLVLFPSNYAYLHECKEVTEGNKYVLTTFFR